MNSEDAYTVSEQVLPKHERNTFHKIFQSNSSSMNCFGSRSGYIGLQIGTTRYKVLDLRWKELQNLIYL